MGLEPPPILPSTSEEFGLPLIWQLAAEPTIDNAQLALADVGVWRSVALLVVLALVPCIGWLLYSARRRFVGPAPAPVPLDYKVQRERAATVAAER